MSKLQQIESLIEAPDDIYIQQGAIVGLKYSDSARAAKFGQQCHIRMGTVIYADVICGDYLQTGHHAMIREKTVVGNHVVIGTNVVIDGNVIIGDFVKIESNCYIPTHMKIGSRVFFGPGVTITNDRYPLKMRDQYQPEGPVIEDGVTIGGGVTIVPGITIGRGSFIAAGAVVTKNIPPMSLVVGVPGRVLPLPDALRETNMALSWQKYLKNPCELED